MIGETIVRHFNFPGEIMRAWWNTEDDLAFRNAFANLKANSEFRPLYDSGLARVQIDQIFNLTLTRVASNNLKPEGWKGALGIGRVKTPTLGIVCKRELEIRNFVARDYFEVSAGISADAGSATLWHRPRGDKRLFSRELASNIRDAATRWQGPVVVTSEHKRPLPPKPLDMTALQKLAGPWGWSASKVLEINYRTCAHYVFLVKVTSLGALALNPQCVVAAEGVAGLVWLQQVGFEPTIFWL
ncbi:hypothetical protein CQ054_20065 [Ochrobactrum sp. MYb29]|nr:hypothetical protein CQ054_20065 [Ochrobactrum sp. MYb29]